MAKEIVFIHTAKEYGSYEDYRLLTRLSGFEICNENQIDPNRDCIYIVTPVNESVMAALKARPKATRKCKVVWLFLERISPPLDLRGGGVVTGDTSFERCKAVFKRFDLPNLFDKIWFADRSVHNQLKSDIDSLFMPVGSDERLGAPPTAKTYDITHMSYVAGRRTSIFNGLKHLKVAPNAWGEERRKLLAATKFMYCAHQDDHHMYEPLRFALCSAFSLPLICENCDDAYPYEPGVDFSSVPYQALVKTVSDAVRSDYQSWSEMGKRMWEKGTKTFRFLDNVKRVATEMSR